MISIRIGTSERLIADATESWINEQVNRRRQDNVSICVEVRVNESGLDMILSSAGCGGGHGGGRPPTAAEQRIFELWGKMHMNSSDFTGGNLIAFLKQIDRAR